MRGFSQIFVLLLLLLISVESVFVKIPKIGKSILPGSQVLACELKCISKRSSGRVLTWLLKLEFEDGV